MYRSLGELSLAKSNGKPGAVASPVHPALVSLKDPGQFLWAQEALGIVTWIWDLQANQVCWFGDLSILLGVPPGQFDGSFLDYERHLHPDDRDRARETLSECITGIHPQYRSEERVLWTDGSIHWLETYGRGEYGPSGHAQRIVGVVKDVTDRKNIELALAQSEERFAKAFRASPLAILVTRLSDGLILSANPNFEEISGYGPSEVIGRTTGELALWIDADERMRWSAELLEHGLVRDFPAQFRTKDGRVVFLLTSSARLDLDGEAGAISLSRDITEQTQVQRKALESQTRYATIFEISPEPMAITRFETGAIIEVNSAFVQQLGRSREDTLGRSGREIGIWANMGDRERVLNQINDVGFLSNFDTQFVHCDGSTHDILLSCSILQVEEQPCVVWAWRDVTRLRSIERARAENERRHREELVRLANEDPLTGLPNRNWLMQRLANVVEHSRQRQSRFAILFVDFDGFKRINDSIGHAVGDELLKAAARRLEHTLEEKDRVARIGGDEFTVILERLEDESEAVELASRMVEAFSRPFQLSAYELTIGISIGISCFPKDGDNGDDLLRSADIAMYEAKASGRGRYHFYTDALYRRLTSRLETERALDEALTRNEFCLHYQPRVSGQDGRLIAFEALLRWNHPRLGLVYPGRFIELAEETGQIVRIGEHVIELVCHQLKEWGRKGHPVLPVSLNVSPQEFQRTELIAALQAALARHALDPQLIEIEITESSTLGPHFDAQRRLAELREIGVRVLIDDFGTGYSSLSQLQKLDVDVLKIDRSFTAELCRTTPGEVLVRTIIEMSKALGMVVVAEGVETPEQFQKLRALGCDEMQGFLISRPVEPDRVESLFPGFVLDSHEPS
ncbi:MAG: EAL domain-containing protein [Burkholderiaceae bacterium]|jgi:diguanylate cyclase (GGDEF)-like protein/PAS domain S-box-containing protein